MTDKLPLTRTITVLAVILILVSSITTLGVLSSMPSNAGASTAEASAPPPFAAAVEAQARNADPSQGEVLFDQYGCLTCHASANGVAPYKVGMGVRAATRRAPAYSAEAYLYESILEPNAFVVPSYSAGVMPQNFKATIPEKDLYTLIAWMLKQ
jgi:mono/diheme cytochrome c family protein